MSTTGRSVAYFWGAADARPVSSFLDFILLGRAGRARVIDFYEVGLSGYGIIIYFIG